MKAKQLTKTRSFKKRKRAKNIFLFCVLVYPVLQFAVFYIGVHFNSILLAFKEYNYQTGSYTWVGFTNFAKFIKDMTGDFALISATKNSFVLYAVSIFILLPVQLLSSFFVYKKIPLSGLFKVILFLPSIVSSIVMTIMFKYFVDKALPEILKMFGATNIPIFLFDPATAFKTIIVFIVWSGFGGGMILFTGAMSRIPDQIIESGKLEGLSLIKEFWYITLPMTFPTIAVFIVVGVAGIFTNQAFLYNFFGAGASQDMQTYGYYLFVKVIGNEATLSDYPYAAAGGLLFTLLVAPFTLVVRTLLDKLVPAIEF